MNIEHPVTDLVERTDQAMRDGWLHLLLDYHAGMQANSSVYEKMLAKPIEAALFFIHEESNALGVGALDFVGDFIDEENDDVEVTFFDRYTQIIFQDGGLSRFVRNTARPANRGADFFQIKTRKRSAAERLKINPRLATGIMSLDDFLVQMPTYMRGNKPPCPEGYDKYLSSWVQLPIVITAALVDFEHGIISACAQAEEGGKQVLKWAIVMESHEILLTFDFPTLMEKYYEFLQRAFREMPGERT